MKSRRAYPLLVCVIFFFGCSSNAPPDKSTPSRDAADKSGNKSKQKNSDKTDPSEVILTGAVTDDPGASSPHSTWELLLAAMRDGDQQKIEKLTTSNGLASLESAVHRDEKGDDVFSRLGHGWTQWEVRWVKQDAHTATAHLGPEAKEHGLVFKKDKDGWKLERWYPGM